MIKKRILAALLGAVLVVATACNTVSSEETPKDTAQQTTEKPQETLSAQEQTVIKIGASPAPHKELLELIAPDLLEKNIKLEIKEFSDYVLPNQALAAKELDANFFQHAPHMVDFNEKNKANLVIAGATHYEPLGIYGGKSKELAQIPEGAKIAVPNDTSNEARALLLLQANGIIKIREGAGLTATKIDIVENTKKIDIVEVEAAQLPRLLPDVDFAVINGNFAIASGLNVADSLAKEEANSDAAQTYKNIVVVNSGDETKPAIIELINALQSEKVVNYINEKYQGAVVPIK